MGEFVITGVRTIGGAFFNTDGDSDTVIYFNTVSESYFVDVLNGEGVTMRRFEIQPGAVDYVREDWVENGDDE
jgi:hypothetical protein